MEPTREETLPMRGGSLPEEGEGEEKREAAERRLGRRACVRRRGPKVLIWKIRFRAS